MYTLIDLLVSFYRLTPVALEAPDGTRHSMSVSLEGVGAVAELRQGMLVRKKDQGTPLLKVSCAPK